MLEYLTNYHQKIFINNTNNTNKIYEYIDPNYELNNFKEIILSQSEILQYILSNNLDTIEIKYNHIYIIKYTQLNTNKIKISPLEPNSAHLLRLIGLNSKLFVKNEFDFELEFELDIEIEKSFLQNILIEIQSYISDFECKNPMDYCSVCGSELGFKGLNIISCCLAKHCTILSKHIVLDNRVTNMYNKDKYLCELLIHMLIEGTLHPKGEKIYSPIPIIKNITNLENLKIILNEQQNNLDISNMSGCSNDIELYRKIGNIAYAIISNAISDNYLSLSTIEYFQTENLPTIKKMESVFDSKDVKFIGLNYSYEIESKFKKEHFLFHGTPMYSWYPIVKNGLKIMSGTEFQANGAAFGNGIYFSDNFNMRWGYSSRTINNLQNKNKQKHIVGVFEITGGIEQHKKSTNIFVISNDKLILLRYLIVIENNNLSSIFHNELTDYFIKFLSAMNNSNVKKITNIKNKRLNTEMKLLNSNNKIHKINAINELENWIIELNEIKGNEIKLNIYFNNYPILPPKILLDSNLNFNIKQNICDSESNILIPELNLSKWQVATNLSKIVDIIYNCIYNSI